MRIVLFLVTLPLIAAIGFDLYLWYEHMDRPFMFTTPGWIWTQYDPDSYKMAVETLDPAAWSWVNFLLAQKTILVTGVFAGVFYVLHFIGKAIATATKRPEYDGARTGALKKSGFKYKRR